MSRKHLISRIHDVSSKLPPLNPETGMSKFVPCIDTNGEISMYRLTEHGWNMRDAPAVNTPADNFTITHWIEVKEITIPEGV